VSSVPPQTPTEEPAGIAHGRPGQQSAFEVHDMPCCLHWPGVPHTNEGAPPGLERQGLPQQSALDAHAEPAGGGVAQSRLLRIVQRGMPLASIWHVGYWLSLPEQQSAFVLHDIAPPVDALPGLQIWPAALHTVST
jgi:hypothetical protein